MYGQKLREKMRTQKVSQQMERQTINTIFISCFGVHWYWHWIVTFSIVSFVGASKWTRLIRFVTMNGFTEIVCFNRSFPHFFLPSILVCAFIFSKFLCLTYVLYVICPFQTWGKYILHIQCTIYQRCAR